MLATGPVEPREVTKEEGLEIIDRLSRRLLDMPGQEFKDRYEAGNLDLDNDDIADIAILLPLAG